MTNMIVGDKCDNVVDKKVKNVKTITLSMAYLLRIKKIQITLTSFDITYDSNKQRLNENMSYMGGSIRI